MTLGPHAENLRSDFITWVTRGPRRTTRQDYALYHRFVTTLSHEERFWERLAASPLGNKMGLYRFMAAIKCLLLAGEPHPVREFYPDLATDPAAKPPLQAGEIFQDFCDQHWERIIELGSSREVQINKVSRCALFLPLFAVAFERGGRQPLALIEVGSSAGFGLLWQHLGYDYGLRGVGAEDAPLMLHCRVFGGRQIWIPRELPPVASQVGLELNPFDLTADEDAHWLIAFTAPNDFLKQQQVRRAIALARRSSPAIRPGCVLDTLENAFHEVPADATCVIFHSLTTHHLQEQAKFERYQDLLRRLSRERMFFQTTVEWNSFNDDYGKPLPLRLFSWEKGRVTSTGYGITDRAADGRWVIST
jgi:hypothetical protein